MTLNFVGVSVRATSQIHEHEFWIRNVRGGGVNLTKFWPDSSCLSLWVAVWVCFVLLGLICCHSVSLGSCHLSQFQFHVSAVVVMVMSSSDDISMRLPFDCCCQSVRWGWVFNRPVCALIGLHQMSSQYFILSQYFIMGAHCGEVSEAMLWWLNTEPHLHSGMVVDE